MNELQLPPAPPLPAEVRERVLRTVLARSGARPRRLAPLVAAAVVVVTLAVSTAVAATSAGTDGPAADAPAPPAPTGDPLAEVLARCASAVAASDARDEYPPSAEWEVTDVLQQVGEGLSSDTTVVLDGTFACNAAAYHVRLSTVGGRPAGAVEVARLSPATLVLFNPQRVPVEVDPGDGQVRSSTAAAQFVQFGPRSPDWPTRRLVVRDSYDGLLPDPGDVAIEVIDRPLPDPQPDRGLEGCLHARLGAFALGSDEPEETVLRQEPQGDTPRALVGRVNGRWAAACYDGPDGPELVEGALAPDRLAETRLVATARRDGLVVALLTVAPDVERVEIMTDPQPGSVGSGTVCTLDDGLAVCLLRADGDVLVRAVDGGSGTVLPVP